MINKQEAQKKGLNIIDSTKENNPLKSMLEQNFPDTLSEGQVSLKAIATLLGINPHSNTQGYELTFTGKGLANTLYTTPVEFELSEEVERSKERESTQNSIIIGDNLDVLKILKSAYYEKIKMIYIDPPYNTKSENFIYPDDFRKDYRKILREVGLLSLDDEGNEVESKTLQTFRNITGSRSHSGWLSFMLPRLKLARDLLKEDGVIFISIDDNEQANLKILCDEIFGEENFVGTFCVENNPKGRKNSSYISLTNDYCLVYAKSKEVGGFCENIPKHSKELEVDEHNRVFSHGRRVLVGESSNKQAEFNSPKHYSVYYKKQTSEMRIFVEKNLDDKRLELINQGYVRYISCRDEKFLENTYTQAKFLELFNDGALIFKENTIYEKDFNTHTRIKSILTNMKYMSVSKNGEFEVVFDYKTETAGRKLSGMGIPFDMPKNVSFLKTLITLIDEDDFTVLDFFAGSGTTAQAVMELNAEDGGNRRFILVQLPEEIKEDKNKTAFDFVKNELGRSEPKISDITIERVRRAGDKLRNEKGATSNVDIGYRVYSLGEKAKLSDEGSIIPHSANITPADIARNLALFAGKPLHTPLEEIVADKLFMCEDILCVVGIDKEVEEKILEEKNKAIFIDGYGTYTLESFLNLNIPNDERVSVVY